MLYIAMASGVNAVATDVLKRIFNRPRPGISYPYPEIDAYKDMKSRSMPSGHTSSSFATATALSLKYPKWYVIVPAYMGYGNRRHAYALLAFIIRPMYWLAQLWA